MAYKSKEDQAKGSKRHYESNKDKIKKRTKKRNKTQRQKNRDYVNDIKKSSACVDCGESNYRVLDFDHVSGEKVMCVSDMINRAYCVESIQKEIDKCEIRCANCHRIVTYERREKNRNLQKL